MSCRCCNDKENYTRGLRKDLRKDLRKNTKSKERYNGNGNGNIPTWLVALIFGGFFVIFLLAIFFGRARVGWRGPPRPRHGIYVGPGSIHVRGDHGGRVHGGGGHGGGGHGGRR